MSLSINYSDPEYVIRNKMEQFLVQKSREKYKYILNFLNDLMKTEYSSLLKIKYVNISKIIKNPKHVITTYNKHEEKLDVYFNVAIDSSNVSSKLLIADIITMLNTINYKFTKKIKTFNNEIVYCINS